MAIKGRFPTTRPSLDLNFAKTKRLDPRITFTRASSGTYVGKDGLLRTAGKDEARFDYSPTTGESLGLLVEEQRTNLVPLSEEFNDVGWVKSNASISANTAVGPNGTTTADKLIEDTATSTHVVQQAPSVVSGTTYTFSCYAKAAGRNFAQLLFIGGFAANVTAIFDLTSGTVGTTAGSPVTTVLPVGNGWYRVSITATATTTTATSLQLRPALTTAAANYQGDGTSGIYIWGAQLEAGAFPTSYIPTTTAAVTRSADVASITGTNFSSWFNVTGGTVYSESDRSTSINSASTIYSVNDNTTNNRFLNARQDSATNLTAISVTAGVSDGGPFTTGLNSSSSRNKIAITQYVNDLVVVSNGTTPASDTSVAIPTVTQLQIGSVTSASYYNGTIRRIVYWNQRLSNAILQDLTR